MDAPNLTVVCATAFAVVFLVLAVLAAAMRLITLLLPARADSVDGPVVAAITSTVGTLLPGARVTRIEEES